jgi:hypothetical protein
MEWPQGMIASFFIILYDEPQGKSPVRAMQHRAQGTLLDIAASPPSARVAQTGTAGAGTRCSYRRITIRSLSAGRPLKVSRRK